MKLKDSIPSNSLKIIDLYNKIDSGLLDTAPIFQRKLVWKKQHKYAFIQTILFNYPFPEIYIASSEMDVTRLKSLEIVVDGQQRLNAIVDYIKGINDFQNQTKLIPFDDLEIDVKKEFLNYSVTVKDLKNIGMETIKEIFKRINSTDYSLNSNEVLNAEFGDGEFAMFCKQLIDRDFNPTLNETDIIVAPETKKIICDFFIDNKIFSDNDIKRMFDVQYIMLLSATILEGHYFGRSNRINYYLEKYNANFELNKLILEKLVSAVGAISDLKFSEKSYWFNKANLFILIIELSKIDLRYLDLKVLESKLLELEKKVDIYFTDEDISIVNDNERKYFEFARQGSHELTAREHRGKLISDVIAESTMKAVAISSDNLIDNNLKILSEKKISYAVLTPTVTGLKKHIMDAVSDVRDFLKENLFHNYESQEFGPDNKAKLNAKYLVASVEKDVEISLYRSNGRGDYRIWFTNLNEFAEPKDELAIINKNDIIYVLNLTKHDYSGVL
jgi:hypothetical protein